MLTGAKASKNFTFGDSFIDIKDAAYLDECIEIIFEKDSLSSLYESISSLRYDRDGFRVRFINTDIHVDFKARKNIEHTVSDIFLGGPDLRNPADDFIVTNIHGKWLFGKVASRTENSWLTYKKMPHTFCNFLPARMARALVNIGTGGKKDVSFLDPCCGMGNVLVQALSLGLDAYGYDINSTVALNANRNLVFFGFENSIKCLDASEIKGYFDVSVADLPYGILSITSDEAYRNILNNLRKVCSRSVILSAGDISPIISDAGFSIIESCISHKGGLDRYITVCC
jgi:tRNA G10  N-methylase Trm11